ncbi:hypothetical protein V6N13_043396 [Hibiscus sabdariffa]
MSENPSMPVSSLQQVGPGGRPPDMVSMAMDHEEVVETEPVQQQSVGGDIQLHGSSAATLSGEIKANKGFLPFYASMVAKNPTVTGTQDSVWKTDNASVVVSEADYIIDRLSDAGSCTTITRNLGIERLLEPSEKEPYGPWMQVAPQWRKPSGLGTSGSCGKTSIRVSGSRFKALAGELESGQGDPTVDEGSLERDAVFGAGLSEAAKARQTSRVDSEGLQMSKNVSYKDAKPVKRSKKVQPPTINMNVVPLVNIDEPTVITQVAVTGGKMLKVRGTARRSLHEGIQLDRPGVRLQIGITSQDTSQPTLFEWIQKFSQDLEEVNAGTCGVPIGQGMDTRQLPTSGVIKSVQLDVVGLRKTIDDSGGGRQDMKQ